MRPGRLGLVSALFVVLVGVPTSAVATTCTSLLSVDAAAVVFDGVARPGPVAPDGTLASPATFEVVRYVKGTGPERVAVYTGTTIKGELVAFIAGSVAPRAGETWRIVVPEGTDLTEQVQTACTKSERLDDAIASPPDPGTVGASTSRASWALLPIALGATGLAWRRWSQGRAPRP